MWDNLIAKTKKGDRVGHGDNALVISAAKRYERAAEERLRATVKRITPFMRAKEYWRKASRKAKAEGKLGADLDQLVAEVRKVDPRAAVSLEKMVLSDRAYHRDWRQNLRGQRTPEQKRAENKRASDRFNKRRTKQCRERCLNEVYTCENEKCGAQWCQIPTEKLAGKARANKIRRFCSKSCHNKVTWAREKAKKAAA